MSRRIQYKYISRYAASRCQHSSSRSPAVTSPPIYPHCRCFLLFALTAPKATLFPSHLSFVTVLDRRSFQQTTLTITR